MTSAWTRENVLRLAPDPSSAKSGQELASPRKWVSFQRDADCIWGLCQGSGSKPYQTIVDLREPAFKCSCPSRKFPCKHGLGLLLLFAGDASTFATAAAPAWVTEWITSRTERAAKKAEAAAKPPEPVDPVAQEQRRQKRMDRITAGLAPLRTWLDDLIREGIAAVPSRGYRYFDEPARRMIDAQAPGVARMIENLAEIANSGDGWHARFLAQLAALHTLLRAAEHPDDLPAATRADMMITLGVPIPQEEVLAQPPIADTWQIVAQETEVEAQLRVQRTWLFGETTRRPMLLLHFAHGTEAMSWTCVAGTQFTAELCPFPGNGIRAMIKSQQPAPSIDRLEGFDTLDALCDAYSQRLAAQPWLGSIVLPLRSVVPVRSGGTWRLVDATNHSLPARLSVNAGWRVLAMSGGHPVDIAARYDGQIIEPLAVMAGGEYVPLGEHFTGGTSLAG